MYSGANYAGTYATCDPASHLPCFDESFIFFSAVDHEELTLQFSVLSTMTMRNDEDSSRSVRLPLLPLNQENPNLKHEEEEDLDDQVGEDWTNHTIYMRRALTYCRKLLLTAAQPAERKQRSASNNGLNVNTAARNLPRDREQGLRNFWAESSETSPTIPTVTDPPSTNFRRTFLHANVPCVIRGADVEAYFGCATSNWILHSETEKGTDISSIDREWFRTRVGVDTLVPIRHAPQPQLQQPSQLDEDGRAVECETKHMPLQMWIDMLDSDSDSSTRKSDPSHYLKDWHLVAWLATQQHKSAVVAEHDQFPLYRTPSIFPYDLLNGFWTRHTDAGDYKFVYWGPARSTTELHSDVLNSYSWSYNVCGCKEWTFYPPSLPCASVLSSFDELESQQSRQDDDDDDDSAAAADTSNGIVVLQRAGECMFVPSGWKHCVVNTEETLSINHNWITVHNLDLVWNCLRIEMRAIEVELTAWGMADDCWDARENMLLGCVGLDVTSFFFMILSRALELLQPDSIDNYDDDDLEIQQFDLVCLGDMLSQRLDDKVLHVQGRLAATLSGDKAAAAAIEMAKTVLNMIDLS
jgi:hypothetical protein